MKPHFHKVPIISGDSFNIRRDVKPYFDSIWHYHPELELHYIIKGEGTQFIGHNVSNFSSGDLIFLGQNLPHTWRCKEDYFLQTSELYVDAIVLHFLPNCLGYDFLDIPEASQLSDFFETSKKGFVINGPSKEVIFGLLQSMLISNGIEKIILLLKIIKELMIAEKYLISGISNNYPKNDSEMAMFNKIYSYTLENYREDLTLDKISNIANMSVTSFCRNFKLITKKTFLDFLIEVRISNACRLLVENSLNIEDIAYKTGFNNLSNFYRQFKKTKNSTPLQYQKKYILNLQSEKK
ncbi:AraC family transcriptional regulator [Flavimarina sp. Hel_I_48]|uniref:AraC family transcriptional regulator n=1 Tax=Flavimarina sp. Hel_I_48 TaxID=1392488 RepID=UPI0004DF35AE|nr:AraC family transcriptional regulator [Flavimarina sp. Hel_I_48]